MFSFLSRIYLLSFLQQDNIKVYGVNVVFFNPDYAVATYYTG